RRALQPSARATARATAGATAARAARALAAAGAEPRHRQALLLLRGDMLQQRLLDLLRDLRVLLQELAGLVATLAEPRLAEADPGPRPLQHAGLDAEVEDLAQPVDALGKQDVELRLAERRRDLVLDHGRLGARSDRLFAVLDLADAPDVDPHRRIELQ